MRTIQTNIYTFSELGDEAKQRAKDDYANLFGYIHADEAFDSLRALAAHFDARWKTIDVDFFNASPSHADFVASELTHEEIATKLKELGSYNAETLKGDGDCKLTGYCSDDDAIDGFRIAFHRHRVRDVRLLMQMAFRTWLKACQDDCADFYTDECFTDHADNNGYEFFKTGKSVEAGV